MNNTEKGHQFEAPIEGGGKEELPTIESASNLKEFKEAIRQEISKGVKSEDLNKRVEERARKGFPDAEVFEKDGTFVVQKKLEGIEEENYKTCSNCGATNIPKNENFCGKCGQRVRYKE